jgi:glycosyltransferase involved in cell wall biosynthesis
MTVPRRVLHVMNGTGGGAALSTLALISVLERHGIASSVVCHDMGSEAEKEAIRQATRGAVTFVPLYWWNKKIRARLWKRPLIELQQGWRTGASMSSSAQVASHALRDQCDLIHTNTILTPEGGRAASFLGLPHVWHVRELLGEGAPFQLPWSGEKLGKVLLRRSSMVVANSPISARPLAPHLTDAHLAVVENGIDLSSFVPRVRAPGTPLVVAMVGNISSRWKKHDLFLRAMAQVKVAVPVELRFYGHADESDDYVHDLRRTAQELGIGERLHFMGHLPPARIMSEIDLLVHPADQESFGRVIVEAMAAGLPVVGVAGGGVAEIVVHEETGFLAPIDDAAAIAGFVTRVLEAPELAARLGQAGRARAQDRYSLEAHGKAMVAVYARAMKRPLGWLGPKDLAS